METHLLSLSDSESPFLCCAAACDQPGDIFLQGSVWQQQRQLWQCSSRAAGPFSMCLLPLLHVSTVAGIGLCHQRMIRSVQHNRCLLWLASTKCKDAASEHSTAQHTASTTTAQCKQHAVRDGLSTYDTSCKGWSPHIGVLKLCKDTAGDVFATLLWLLQGC